MKQWIVNVWAAISFIGIVTVVIVGLAIWRHGFEARSQPSSLEATVAMAAQDSSIPERYKEMSNPLPVHGIDLIQAGGHYEEDCAACHGDNGSGEPKFDGLMYPRPVNLLSEDTQQMSDGELYWVIKNGVRWSGMPAFGKPGDDDELAWKMVAYVRHLPQLTPAEERQVLQQSREPMNHGNAPYEHSH